MGSTNEAPVETSAENNTQPTTTPGTEEVAARLREEGYKVAHQPGRPAVSSRQGEPVAFIKLNITHNEKEKIENILKEVDPAVPHRTIGPDDTNALPNWAASTSPENDTDANQQRIYVIPSPIPSPSAEQKAEHRASTL